MHRPVITDGLLARLPPRWHNGETLRFESWFLTIPGAMLLLLAATFALSTVPFVVRAIETDATVVTLEERRRSGQNGQADSTTYAAVFGFRTAEGRGVEVASPFSSSHPAWERGERLRVLYDPRDPMRATPATLWSVWFWEILFGLPGALMIGIGAAMRGIARHVDRAVDRTASHA